MNARIFRNNVQSPSSGFSMIDVLVAVVVLSVGLLALAALQGNIVRGSSAARVQTQAMALAQEKLEQLRGFTSEFTTTANTAGTYDGIMPATETLTTVAGNTGANTFTRTTTVTRYQLNPDGNGTGKPAFVKVNNCSGGGSGCPKPSKNEFKRVTVTVSTTDSSGNTTTVQAGDVISSASPSDAVNTQAATNSTHPTPQVWIDPSKFAPGVIPIALGGGKAAAASDPQPETFSTGHITTRFSVQNYNTAANANGLVLLNKQFDFAATSCTCNVGSTSTYASPAYGPTYWNGTRYTTPTAIPSTNGGTGKATGTDPVSSGNPNNSSQDPILCQACCRDHHDDKNVQLDANNKPLKFDPFRPSSEYSSSGDHLHYDLDASNNLLTSAVSGNGAEYYETCRFVRVDGVNRVATDARLENHIVISPPSTNPSSGQINITAPGHSCDPTGDSITSGTCYDHLLDSTSAGTYANFVKDYVAGTQSGTGNSGVTGFYDTWKTSDAANTYPVVNGAGNSVTYPVGNLLGNITVDIANGNQSGTSSTLGGLAAYSALLNPPVSTPPNTISSDLQTTYALATNATLYLEGRGVYIDYISPETKIAINCVGQTTNPDCSTYANSTLLQVIPFVAVNLTNLDAWIDNDNSGALGSGSNATSLSNDPIPTGGTYDPYIIGYQFDRGSAYFVDQTPCKNGSGTSAPPCSSSKPNIPDYGWARARRGNAGLIDSLSISPSYPYEAYYCMATWSGNTPPEPTGVCANDPPASGQQYATVTNATGNNGSTAADGVNFRSDTQPYTSTGSVAYNLFNAYTYDKTSGNAKSTLGNPIAISVTQPTMPRTITTCKLGKGGKQPFHCYDSDATSSYSPVVMNFANYNTQVSCNGNNCPVTPVINTYNLCKVAVTYGTGGTATVGSTVTVTNSGTLNEQSSITLTLAASPLTKANIDTFLPTVAVKACFAASNGANATSCSAITCP